MNPQQPTAGYPYPYQYPYSYPYAYPYAQPYVDPYAAAYAAGAAAYPTAAWPGTYPQYAAMYPGTAYPMPQQPAMSPAPVANPNPTTSAPAQIQPLTSIKAPETVDEKHLLHPRMVQIDKKTMVWVGKIDPKIDNDLFNEILQCCGPMESWKRVSDPTTGNWKKFGFAEFCSAEGGLRALRILNGFKFGPANLELKVESHLAEWLKEYQKQRHALIQSLPEADRTPLIEGANDPVGNTPKEMSVVGESNEKADKKSDEEKAESTKAEPAAEIKTEAMEEIKQPAEGPNAVKEEGTKSEDNKVDGVKSEEIKAESTMDEAKPSIQSEGPEQDDEPFAICTDYEIAGPTPAQLHRDKLAMRKIRQLMKDNADKIPQVATEEVLPEVPKVEEPQAQFSAPEQASTSTNNASINDAEDVPPPPPPPQLKSPTPPEKPKSPEPPKVDIAQELIRLAIERQAVEKRKKDEEDRWQRQKEREQMELTERREREERAREAEKRKQDAIDRLRELQQREAERKEMEKENARIAARKERKRKQWDERGSDDERREEEDSKRRRHEEERKKDDQKQDSKKRSRIE